MNVKKVVAVSALVIAGLVVTAVPASAATSPDLSRCVTEKCWVE